MSRGMVAVDFEMNMAAKESNLQEVLDRLDAATAPLDDREIHEAISTRLREDREAGRVASPAEIAEWAAFMFSANYQWKEDGWDSYYGPMWSGINEDGKTVFTPDIHQFDSNTFEYWQKRACEAKHPVFRIRYADLCWDFQKRYGGVAPAIDLARIAIDETIDATSQRLVKRDLDGKTKLARALAISLAIGDASRVIAVRDAIVSYEDAVARDELAGLWGFSFDLIVEDRKVPRSAEMETKIIAELEGRLARLAELREGKPVDPWGAQHAAVRLAKYYRRQDKPDEVRRVLLAYGMAFERLAEGATGMLASGWMRLVHDRYREFGLREEAEALLLKVREAAKRSHDEMVRHSEQIEIPKEEMDAILDRLTEGTLSDSLNHIAFEFLPNKQQVVDQLKDLQKSAPLMSLMPVSIVDHEGRPTAQIGSTDDDLEGRVIHHVSQNMQFAYLFLYLAIDRVREKFGASVDAIIDHLRQSPVFPEDVVSMLRPGLRLYFNDDHLAASHVLIPQIEASIRHLLHVCGGNLWKPHRGGGMMLKNLEDLLREDAIVRSLSENGVLNLRVLLTDQRGWNIRNNVCHGLMKPESFGRGMTDRLFHALLLLACVRMRTKEPPAA